MGSEEQGLGPSGQARAWEQRSREKIRGRRTNGGAKCIVGLTWRDTPGVI